MPRSNPTPSVGNYSEIRGVWIANVGSSVLFAPWGINRAIHQLSQQNFNRIYPVVWNRGHTFYRSQVANQAIGRYQDNWLQFARFGRDILPEIINLSHRRGLTVMPWFEYGFMVPANSQFAKQHPGWLTEANVNPNTDGEEENFSQVAQPLPGIASHNLWLNPLHPQVQQFILDLIKEVVQNYDVDGIQLDDHFAMPVELGYDLLTVKLYREEHQGNPPPKDYLNAEWMRWRANKLSEFMARVYREVKRIKPECVVSLSPNPQGFAYRHYLQDWQRWVDEGWVDELILQVYRDKLSDFTAELDRRSLQMARRRIPVGIGILSGTLTNPVTMEEIQQQVQVVRDRGFDGFSFFYWETLWSYLTPESPQVRRQAFGKLLASPGS
ncbi:family 10 glycosylhydrolase [Phormidium sp. CCY1219]|nr:family 10 glycosylhydrolase [Phormidium sp. CCY1219]